MFRSRQNLGFQGDCTLPMWDNLNAWSSELQRPNTEFGLFQGLPQKFLFISLSEMSDFFLTFRLMVITSSPSFLSKLEKMVTWKCAQSCHCPLLSMNMDWPGCSTSLISNIISAWARFTQWHWHLVLCFNGNVVIGQRLDLMVLEIFSKLNDLVILRF